MTKANWRGTLAMLAVLLTAPSWGVGADWPAIPAAERELTAVAGFPNAPAVVLWREGHLELSQKTLSSFLDVYARVKILTSEGTPYGTVAVSSSDYYRMKNLEARVNLPDGTVVPMDPAARFEQKWSLEYDRMLTSVALPRVGPGAIVEYRYRLYFDSLLFPEPWYFQDVIPTRRSTIVCSIPKNYEFKPHVVMTVNRPLHDDVAGGATGFTATYTAEDLPPIPDEPGSWPFQDLASRITFLPRQMMAAGRVPLLESWESLVKIVQGDRTYGYEFARKHAGSARARGKDLAPKDAEARSRVAAVFAFVRDEVATEPFTSVGDIERKGDEVLAAGKGTPTEKALLLAIMLDAAGVDASVGWTGGRRMGRIDPAVVNPAQFSHTIVVADVVGQKLFLDPSDRALAAGALAPDFDGVPCLLVDGKKPTWVTTPALPAADSVRDATVALRVTTDGSVTGKGRLVLTGHHAYERLLWRATRGETLDEWRRWLEGKYPGYDIADLELAEDVEMRKVEVSWTLAQRAEEVLEGEATIAVAAPLGQRTNPFAMPPERRVTPVQVAFRDSDRVTIEVTMADGWRVESEPGLKSLTIGAGRLTTSVERDGSIVVLRRTLDVTETEFMPPQGYADVRRLQAAAVANDAEVLVLSRS